MVSLFDAFFESSYHEKLSVLEKESLRNSAKEKIKSLSNKLDSGLSGLNAAQEAYDIMKKQEAWSDHALFSTDFALGNKKNRFFERLDCAVYAEVFLSLLENADRADVLGKMSYNSNYYHCWLDFDDYRLEINKLMQKWRTRESVECLKGVNYNMVGARMFDKGDFDEALSYFDKAICVSPKNPQYISNKANALFRKGFTKEAFDAIEIAIDADPLYPYPIETKSFMIKECGKDGEAKKLGKKAAYLAKHFND